MSENYRKVRPVGSGPMGSVYEGWDEPGRRPVAIKELAPSLAADGGFLRAVLDGARATGEIDHPHVLEVYGIDPDQETPWIVQEWADGGSLKDLLELRPLQPEPAMRILRDALLGLQELHRLGRVHANLKPENVLRCDAVYKVADPAPAEGGDPSQHSGLPRYTAPESLEAAVVKPASDLYSLGLMIYELVVGPERFAHEVGKLVDGADAASASDGQTWFRFHLGEAELPALSDIDETVPEEVAHLVRKLTAKHPEERYGSCDEVLQDLDELMAKLDGDDGGGASRGLSPKLLAALGAGAVVLLTLAFVVLKPPSTVVLSVTSEPAGASVAIAGQTVGSTPMQDIRLPPGTTLVLSHPGFEDAMLRVSAQKPQLHAALTPVSVSVAVTSQPAGATVVVGGKTMGVTPLSELAVALGTEVAVKKAGFKPKSFKAREPRVHVELEAVVPPAPPPQPLILTSEPAEARVRLAGDELGSPRSPSRSTWSGLSSSSRKKASSPCRSLRFPVARASTPCSGRPRSTRTRPRALRGLVRELRRLVTFGEELRIRLDSAEGDPPHRLPLGAPVSLRLDAEREGFAALFVLDAQGLLTCIYPSIEVEPGKSLVFPPEGGRRLTAQPPLGRDLVVALLTPEPLELPPGDAEASAELHAYPWRTDRTVNPAVELVRRLNETRRAAPEATRLVILEIEVTGRS